MSRKERFSAGNFFLSASYGRRARKLTRDRETTRESWEPHLLPDYPSFVATAILLLSISDLAKYFSHFHPTSSQSPFLSLFSNLPLQLLSLSIHSPSNSSPLQICMYLQPVVYLFFLSNKIKIIFSLSLFLSLSIFKNPSALAQKTLLSSPPYIYPPLTHLPRAPPLSPLQPHTRSAPPSQSISAGSARSAI